MVRLFKVLPPALTLLALSIFLISCGSSNSTQARFINAISDTQAYGNVGLDIDVNTTKEFTNVTFGNIEPTSGYTSVPSGSNTINGFQTNSTTAQVFSSSATLASGKQYTMIATGFASGSHVALINAPDTNTAPANGNVSFRVINASPSGPTAVDIYIVPVGSAIGSPTISGVAYQQSSSYATQAYNSNTSNGFNYFLYVAPAGSSNYIVNQGIPTVGGSSVGSIRTIVLTDVANGNPPQMSPNAIILSDLN
jgi:hypothetical protein